MALIVVVYVNFVGNVGTPTYMHTKNNLQRGLELDQGIGFRPGIQG